MADTKKKELAEALRKTLETKSLSKITVTEIAKECGINRQSFYYHFKDVYELAEYMYKNDIVEIIKSNENADDWTEIVSQLFLYAVMNREILLNTINDIDSEVVLRELRLEIKTIIIRYISDKEKLQKFTLSKENEEMISEFYMYAIGGEIMEWFKKGMQEIPEQKIRGLTFFFTDGLDVLLQKTYDKERGKENL